MHAYTVFEKERTNIVKFRALPCESIGRAKLIMATGLFFLGFVCVKVVARFMERPVFLGKTQKPMPLIGFSLKIDRGRYWKHTDSSMGISTSQQHPHACMGHTPRNENTTIYSPITCSLISSHWIYSPKFSGKSYVHDRNIHDIHLNRWLEIIKSWSFIYLCLLCDSQHQGKLELDEKKKKG